MRFLSVILFIFCFFVAVQKAQAVESVFFESLYDVPIMSGLEEVKEMSLNFDKVEGRIAYASAVADNMDQAEILSFYRKTLPQMGWQKISSGIFTREQEKLEISFEKTKGSPLIRFSLMPVTQ